MSAKPFVGRLAFCDIESFAANTKTNVGPLALIPDETQYYRSRI